MANIDLTLTDSDFGVEELPEGNALGCAFCGACASCPSCAACSSCPSCAGGGRQALRPPPPTPPRTDLRES